MKVDRAKFAAAFADAYIYRYHETGTPDAGVPIIEFDKETGEFSITPMLHPGLDKVGCCWVDKDMVGDCALPAGATAEEVRQNIIDWLADQASDELWAEVQFRIDWEIDHG